LALLLEIQPLVVLPGSSRQDLAVRNKPIRIDVKVHPHKKALAEVSSAAEDLQIVYPDRWFVGKQAKVEASLSLKGHRGTVQADIALDRGPGSVPATIQPAESPQGNDQFVGSWLVTPAEAGPVDMLFTVKLSTQAGDLPLTDKVILQRSVRAEPAPPSLGERLQAPVNWLTPFVAVLGGVVAVLGGLLAIRPAWRRRRHGGGDDAETANSDNEPADG
jgi:hypothetical protein